MEHMTCLALMAKLYMEHLQGIALQSWEMIITALGLGSKSL